MENEVNFCGKVIIIVNGEEYFLHIEDPQNYDLFKFAEQFFLELNYHLNDEKQIYNITEINYNYENSIGPIIGIESFDPRIILSNQLVDKTIEYKNYSDTLMYYIGDNGGSYFIFGQELIGKMVAKIYVNRLTIER